MQTQPYIPAAVSRAFPTPRRVRRDPFEARTVTVPPRLSPPPVAKRVATAPAVLIREQNIRAAMVRGVDPGAGLAIAVKAKKFSFPSKNDPRYVQLPATMKLQLSLPTGVWAGTLASKTRDAWEGDFSVTELLRAAPAAARLAPAQLQILLAVLPYILDVFESIHNRSQGDAVRERELLDESGFDVVAYDAVRQFFLKKLVKKVGSVIKKVAKVALPVVGTVFPGIGTAISAVGGKLLGGAKVQKGTPASSTLAGSFVNAATEYGKKILAQGSKSPQTNFTQTEIVGTYPAQLNALAQEYNRLARERGFPLAELTLAAVLESRTGANGAGYSAYQNAGFVMPSGFDAVDKDCCRDAAPLMAFQRGDERYAPKGEFFTSPWISARLDDLPSGVYGMIHTGRKPMEMTINRKVEKPRLMLSYAHEGVHAMDKLFKLGLSHDQVHSSAAFLIDNVLPGLARLDAIVQYSDDDRPSHVLST